MKKLTMLSFTIILSICLLTTISNATFIVNMNMEGNAKIVELGETKTLIISVNEPVYVLNFNINYDSQVFKLVGSETENLGVAEKDGKIACIYADSTGIGTQEFKIKFEAIQETTNGANFSIENAKFSTTGQEESYKGNQITGLEQPLTLTVLNSEIKTIYNSDIIQGQKTLGIMFKNTYTDNTITKSTFMQWTDDVKNLYDKDGNIKADSDLIKTGDKIEIGKETLSVVLYGDANGDGIVCDADDVMIIINDFLGKKPATGINRVATNLANADDELDTDDLMQMINRFLGRLNNDLVKNLPQSTINPYEEWIDLEFKID